MPKIIIWTMENCPYCKKAKKFFEDLKLSYENNDITDNQDEMFDMLYKKTGCSTVPQIFINDEFIGGFDDLVVLYKNNPDKILKD